MTSTMRKTASSPWSTEVLGENNKSTVLGNHTEQSLFNRQEALACLHDQSPPKTVQTMVSFGLHLNLRDYKRATTLIAEEQSFVV